MDSPRPRRTGNLSHRGKMATHCLPPPSLAGHLDDVLNTLHLGRRQQDALQPLKYFYHRRCETLPGHYNSITVVVLYRGDDRYVVTAWPEVEE